MKPDRASLPGAVSEAHSISLPLHVGIIMDGNGRWAKERNKNRSAGHKQGLETAKAIVKRASERNIPYLSLYVFSTENWKRAVEEVGFLMNLIDTYILAELPFYREHNIRLCFSGDLSSLPSTVQKNLMRAREETRTHTGTVVNLAVNYGGRDEILRAIRSWYAASLSSTEAGQTPKVDESILRRYFDNPDIPDLDLVIRTAGEYRTSNFFIWQSAYAELCIDNKYWPDWTGDDFDRAIEEFAGRTRRYGGL